MSAPRPDISSPECECGCPKLRQRPCCDRCLWLDGRGSAMAAVIAALREASEPMTLAELSEATGRSISHLQHLIIRMRKEGRLSRHGDGVGWSPYRYELDAGRVWQ